MTAESVGNNAIKGTTRKAPHHFPSTIVRADSGVAKSTSRPFRSSPCFSGHADPARTATARIPMPGREAWYGDQVGVAYLAVPERMSADACGEKTWQDA